MLLGIDKVTLPLSYEQFEELFKEVERDYQVEIENENERIYCIKKICRPTLCTFENEKRSRS